MKPSIFHHICILLSLASGALPIVASAQQPKRPNVVLIMTDNHGAWTLGCYGNPDIRTPNIDRLAADGTLFTRAFASNPVCSPTRATVLTGLVPSQHGVHSFLAGGNLQTGPDARCTLDEFTSLPEVLREQGYACGLVGKWHLGANLHPQEGLEDYWITMPHGGTSTFYNAQVIENGAVRKEPKYLTDLWTEHAVKFIDQQAAQEKPFFLFLAYNGPYALSRLLLRDGQNRHAEYYADKQIESFPRSETHPWQYANRDFINNPTSIRRVATEVSGVDDGVGDVMQALASRGLDENTIVLFVADQGWVGGHGGFFGMGDHTRPLTARDGMMQIPLIWRHPKQIAASVRSDKLLANYDIMPTLLGHLGMADKMPTSPKSPGRDFSDLLKPNSITSAAIDSANRQIDDEAIFYEFENLRCIRTTTHKYVHRQPNGPHELYDLEQDPDEFVNLAQQATRAPLRDQLKSRLDAFYAEYALPKYDLWQGGASQVRIHAGIDEELAQRVSVPAPPLTAGFQPAPIDVPEGFSVELVAGPPLVTHPTMACFDDSGHLYVCNNAGVNMTNDELENSLPNSIRRLVDRDQDGTFDAWTVFADKMTFPMGCVWQNGSLYVASPPNIWKLTDTNDDGVADKRELIVDRFGYNGNAASIHGCFAGPDGRIYWTDGFHGHEFKDGDGNVTSKRQGAYIFSAQTDGSDVRIHCGGGMDNPVEIDFTKSGDMLGTVNILYTRPRVDCLVHWLYGGAYPHREKVLEELKVTGDLLGPAHRFGHVAVSGMTRYRGGVLDHRWQDDLFVTFFNNGKVVRLELQNEGSTHSATQHEFLSSTSREFHPTDVLEDADGSLLVVDTGGWFYRGCPTSQFSKPELLGGIYRVRRDGMTTAVDPRGLRIDWNAQTPTSLVKLLNDTRVAVRQRAISECALQGADVIPTLKTTVARGDSRVRQNAVWALTRLAQQKDVAEAATDALQSTLQDALPSVRQAALHGLALSRASVDCEWVLPLLLDTDAAVRRQAATTLGILGDAKAVASLVKALERNALDRSEEHAIIYALIEIGDASAIRQVLNQSNPNAMANPSSTRGVLVALDQIEAVEVSYDEFLLGLESDDPATLKVAARIASQNPQWSQDIAKSLLSALEGSEGQKSSTAVDTLLPALIGQAGVAEMAGGVLQSDRSTEVKNQVLRAIASSPNATSHPSWLKPLEWLLGSSNHDDVAVAVAAAASLAGNQFSPQLTVIAEDRQRPISLRMDALAALARKSGKVDDAMLDHLIHLYRESGSPTAASRSAQIMGTAQLTSPQLMRLTPLLSHASPMQLRDFNRAFQKNVELDVASSFLTAMESAEGLMSLEEFELSDVIKRFPPETLERGNKILDRLKQHKQQRLVRLEQLRAQLVDGNAERGREVFVSEKAKCSSCHQVGKAGKPIGPDLTTIGANRSGDDLLESIVFPSASIVRDYQSHKILTTTGQAITGLVVRESADTIEVQQANGEVLNMKHDDIELIAPSTLSIMPAGLDETLTEAQLIDVVAYLQSLK